MTERSKPVKNRPLETKLSCGHSNMFRAPQPEPGDLVWCRMCRDYKIVAGLWFQYHLACNRCRLGKYYGQDLGEARRASIRHIATRPDHVVYVMVGNRTIERHTWQNSQDQLPLNKP